MVDRYPPSTLFSFFGTAGEKLVLNLMSLKFDIYRTNQQLFSSETSALDLDFNTHQLNSTNMSEEAKPTGKDEKNDKELSELLDSKTPKTIEAYVIRIFAIYRRPR